MNATTKVWTVLTLLFSLQLLSCAAPKADTAACEQWIVETYRKWMKGEIKELAERKELFTPEMWEKRGRLASVQGADPLIRAQDYSEYGLESLSCKHLADNWYEVSYAWSEEDEPIHIPVRINTQGGHFRFDYITPSWGKWLGDKLFDIAKPGKVDQETASKFVTSFYRQYTYLYALMVPDLEQKLMQMQEKYCTKAMLQKINDLKEELEGDMDEGLDLLVMNHDFDIYWYSTLKIEPLTENTFSVNYRIDEPKGTYTVKVKVTATREDGAWKIDNIEKN